MDVVVDYAAFRGVGREEALNETLSWMIHVLHRRDVDRFEQARLHARAVHVAVAPTAGCEGGARAYHDFLTEMDDLIRSDPFADPQQRTGPTAEEIATFERFARAAGS